MNNFIIACGPVIVEKNKVLLVKHNDNFFKFPGGTLKLNENFVNCVKREAKEELNINIKILDNNPFLIYSKKKINNRNCDIILIHYISKRIGNIKLGKDIEEFKWIEFADLKKYKLGKNIIPTLKYFKFIK